jgi:hypothetical protein
LAAPPEFYADENTVTRSVRDLLTGLGYVLHSPAELYGSRDAALGARDEDWLARVGRHRWTVLGRDLKIYERPSELAAYRASRLQVFLLPGQARGRTGRACSGEPGAGLRDRIHTPARDMASYQQRSSAIRDHGKAPQPQAARLRARDA